MFSIKSDWTGDTNSVFKVIGASNHTDNTREEYDYYATQPEAMELLLDLEQFDQNVWECACGEGHLSKVLEQRGYTVRSTDLIDRGFGEGGVDFLDCTKKWDGDIITNPPYKFATEFAWHGLNLIEDGHRLAMFLKLSFLETKKRRELFEAHPPKYIYVATNRFTCAKNGDFTGMKGALAYCWMIWEKGFKGEPVVRWFN